MPTIVAAVEPTASSTAAQSLQKPAPRACAGEEHVAGADWPRAVATDTLEGVAMALGG
jgi:hypothetical protein